MRFASFGSFLHAPLRPALLQAAHFVAGRVQLVEPFPSRGDAEQNILRQRIAVEPRHLRRFFFQSFFVCGITPDGRAHTITILPVISEEETAYDEAWICVWRRRRVRIRACRRALCLGESGHRSEIHRRDKLGSNRCRPVFLINRVLVDGGVMDNCPVAAVKAMGADAVVAVDLVSVKPVDVPFGSVCIVLERVLSMNLARLAKEDTRHADLVLQPEVGWPACLIFPPRQGAWSLATIMRGNGSGRSKRCCYGRTCR